MQLNGTPRLILYIDGFCLYCRATARAIARLDVLRLVRILSYREDESYLNYGITRESADGAMQAIVLKKDGPLVVEGFGAVQAVARALPLLWPLVPVLWGLDRVGLGNRVYRFLADHRILVPDAQVCRIGAGTCNVEGENVIMPKANQVKTPWLRMLSVLALFAMRSGTDPRFAAFGFFAFFVLSGHANKWLRGLAYLGFLGFLGIIPFLT